MLQVLHPAHFPMLYDSGWSRHFSYCLMGQFPMSSLCIMTFIHLEQIRNNYKAQAGCPQSRAECVSTIKRKQKESLPAGLGEACSQEGKLRYPS